MDAGTKLYEAYVWNDPINSNSGPFHITEGIVTGVVIDGQPMIRCRNKLEPLNERNWCATRSKAVETAWRELVRRAGALQSLADRIRDEMLHDDLTSEEPA